MKEGMRYLESTLLTMSGVPDAAAELVSALLQISMLPGIKNSWVNSNAVRATAFILADLDLSIKAMELAESTVDKMKNGVEKVQVDPELLAESVKGEVKDVVASLKSQVVEAIKELGNNLKKAAKGVSNTTDKLVVSVMSYRDVLTCSTQKEQDGGAHLRQPNPRLRPREGVRSRQVLVDVTELEDLEVVRQELVVEIMDRANKALCKAEGELAGHSFKAVTKLKNGGILLKLDSEEVFQWFHSSKSIRRMFTGKFHKSSVIKPRAFHIVVQFVPLTFYGLKGDRGGQQHGLRGYPEGEMDQTSCKMQPITSLWAPNSVIFLAGASQRCAMGLVIHLS